MHGDVNKMKICKMTIALVVGALVLAFHPAVANQHLKMRKDTPKGTTPETLQPVRPTIPALRRSREVKGPNFVGTPLVRSREVGGVNFIGTPLVRSREVIGVNFVGTPTSREMSGPSFVGTSMVRSREVSGVNFVGTPLQRSREVGGVNFTGTQNP